MLRRFFRRVSTLLRAFRMARKPLDVLMRPFRVDIMKQQAFLREASHVHTLVLGSSHAYNGWVAQPGEFNYGLRNCDLYHACSLYRRFSERGLVRSVKNVVLFYDVFSPGFLMEKTSRGSLAIPYFHLWDIPYQGELRIDHRVIDRRLKEMFAQEARRMQPPEGYLGNASYARGSKPPPEVHGRVRAHLKHNARPDDQTRFLEGLVTCCCRQGHQLLVVMPPVRKDYADLLTQPQEVIFARLIAFCTQHQVKMIDLTRDERFEDSDFLDSDHLALQGAEKLTAIIRGLFRG